MSTPLFNNSASYVTREEYNKLEAKFVILEGKCKALEDKYYLLCSILDIDNTSDSQSMKVDNIEAKSKVVEVYPNKAMEFTSSHPYGRELSEKETGELEAKFIKNPVSVSSFSQRPSSTVQNTFNPSNQSSLVSSASHVPSALNIPSPFGPNVPVLKTKELPISMNISPPRVSSSPPRVSISPPPKADLMGRSYTVPLPKISLRNLASDTLHVISDYGTDAVLLHGYDACVKLKDQYLKPIGFRFSNDLPIGAGWVGNKNHYAQLREQMRKNNSKIQVDEFLMDQITK